MASLNARSKTSLVALTAAFLLSSAGGDQHRGASGGSHGGGGFSAPSWSASSGGFSSGGSAPARSYSAPQYQRPSSPPPQRSSLPEMPRSAPPERTAPPQRYVPPPPVERPQPRDPVVRYAPPGSRPSAPPENRLENRNDVSRGVGADRNSFAPPSDGPSRRVYDSEREGTATTGRADNEQAAPVDHKDAGSASPDLSHWGRPVRTPVPTFRDSSDTFRPAPVRGASPSTIDRLRAPSSRVDRESILDRYRGRDRSSIPGKGPNRGVPTTNPEPSRPRGGDSRTEVPSGKRALPGDRVGAGPSQRRTPPFAPPLSPPLSKVPGERRHDDSRGQPIRAEPKRDAEKMRSRDRDKSQLESVRRLDRLSNKDPKTASKILGKGREITVATDAAVRAAISVSLNLGCGGNSGNCGFWDPCRSWTSHCGPFWNWWWSPSCSWWWSSCCCPWWGCGSGFGYWSNH